MDTWLCFGVLISQEMMNREVHVADPSQANYLRQALS